MFMFVPKHVSLSDCCFVGKIVSRRMRNPASLKGGKPEVDLMRNEHWTFLRWSLNLKLRPLLWKKFFGKCSSPPKLMPPSSWESFFPSPFTGNANPNTMATLSFLVAITWWHAVLVLVSISSSSPHHHWTTTSLKRKIQWICLTWWYCYY